MKSTTTAHPRRERPDTIRSIVANLVGDDDSGDSLVDENEPIQPLQALETDDYNDPNWDPEPIDAGPGASPARGGSQSLIPRPQTSARTSRAT